MSNSRPNPTLADYMAIAISPALIVVLVGSLAFFLLMVFYSGSYEGRLYWTTGCFVFAAVLISRISIVEGAERASMFGLALGVVAALAMMRFTNHPWGAWLVLGVIWWCASHLVWNCTLVDDEDDASGEGLLEAAGFDASLTAAVEPATTNAATARQPLKRKRQKESPPPPPPTLPQPFSKRWFAWWQKSASRTAPPGLTVVYFSLAALPIFGIGQHFVATDQRRYAFQLMIGYVASALGLLLTTSFLGLRRYLRQRNLEMPIEMAGSWLGVGAAIGVAILVLAMLIPRPNPEYAISSLTGSLSSPDREASSYAPMHDSPAQGDSSSKAPANDPAQSNQDQQQGSQQANAADAGPSGNASGEARNQQPASADGSQTRGEGSKSSADGSQSGTQQSPSGADSSSQGAAGKSNDAAGDRKPSGAPSGDRGEQRGEQRPQQQNASSPAQADTERNKSQGEQQRQQSGQSGSETRNATQPRSQKPKNTEGETDEQQQQQQEQDKRNQPAEPQPEGSSSRMAQAMPPQMQQPPSLRPPGLLSGAGLLWALRMLLYAALVIVGIYFLVRYWPQVRSFLASAWLELQLLWRSIFGGSTANAEVAELEAQQSRAKPFAAFPDPFASGAARRYAPNALVKYSFEALEAWADERGAGRHAEETPLEFAARLANDHPSLAEGVRDLASLYARAAYARETLAPEDLQGAQRLWVSLRRTAAPVAPA